MGKFLDAAVNGAVSSAGKAFFFKGTKYVRYDWAKDQGDPGYPLGLDVWGFPPPFDKGIDAAIEGREEYEKKAFFFKDDKYLKFDWAADKIDSGYPKSIDAWDLPKDFFAGGKKKIDAVVNGAGESARYCYLFSGGNWVRIDWKEEEEAVLHKGGVLKDWDLPAEIAKGIDAALSGVGKKYGGKAYFFKDQKYARFDWSADKCDLKNGDLGAWKISLDDASPGPGQPASGGGDFQPIVDKATEGPVAFDGEKAWVLDSKVWHDLLTTVPGKDRGLGGLPIGGMQGWLNMKAKPVIVDKFDSKADGKNSTGLLTYKGNYLLWRHAIHHNHNPTGGPENTGTYDAFEAYKLPADTVAKYNAKKKG